MVAGLAESVAVGIAAGGGGGGAGGGATGAFFLHPPANVNNKRQRMTEARLRDFCLFIYPSPPMELVCGLELDREANRRMAARSVFHKPLK